MDPVQPSKQPEVNEKDQKEKGFDEVFSGVTNNKPSKIGSVFLFFLFLTALIVWVWVVYTYIQNRNIKNNELKTKETTAEVNSFDNPFTIGIINGDVVKNFKDGSSVVIVSKNEYGDTGIAGFSRATPSPDGLSVCIESLPPSPNPAIFISDTQGSTVKKISDYKLNCRWSNDSQWVAYESQVSENDNVDIFLYDIKNSYETNFTQSAFDKDTIEKEPLVNYSFKSWSRDDSQIYLSYIEEDKLTSCTVYIQSLEKLCY